MISFAGTPAQIDGSGFVTPSAIPEPSTYAVFGGIAVLGLAIARRRKTGARSGQ